MRRRYTFAAPFLFTVVTALPGCPKSSGETTTVTNNDPQPEPEAEPTEPTGEPYHVWNVSGEGGACGAYMKVSCPEGAMCNPPPPAKVQCPEGYVDGEDVEMRQYEEDGECWTNGKTTPCPTWD